MIAYPTKALTTIDFYIKVGLIAVAMVVTVTMGKRLPQPATTEPTIIIGGKSLAIWSLLLWGGTITAGRLIAYTFKYQVYIAP